MVPTAAVGPIVAACRHEAIDFTALGEAAVGAGNLAIPLVKQLTARVKARDPDAARYVHWGATSQDAIDTGLVLQLRGALDAAERLLERLLAALAGQADRYRDTVMPGRTSDAARAAGDLWSEAGGYPRRAPALAAAAARDASASAGAAVRRRRGDPGRAKRERAGGWPALAQNLGLTLPDTPWHSQRDRLLEAGAGSPGSAAPGKFANDFSLLMQTEVAEVGEPVAEGRGGSSTMPHKRNPVACAAILTAAQRTPGLMATLYACQIQQHERALGGWQAEWETLPELITPVGGALAQSEALVRDMQVFPQKMRADLDITHGLIMAEAVTRRWQNSSAKPRRIIILRRCAVRRWTASVRWSICSRRIRRSASISPANV